MTLGTKIPKKTETVKKKNAEYIIISGINVHQSFQI